MDKYEFKIERNAIDFSKLDEQKIDNLQSSFGFDSIMKKVAEEIQEQIDIVRVKEALIKAKLYDLDFNPHTVTENEKHHMISSFCKWTLNQIKDNSMTKKEIIDLLERYAKDA